MKYKALLAFLWYLNCFYRKTHLKFQTKGVTGEARDRNSRTWISTADIRNQLPLGQGQKFHADLLQSTASQTKGRYGNKTLNNNYFLLWGSYVIVTVTGIKADGSQSKYHTFSQLEPKEKNW